MHSATLKLLVLVLFLNACHGYVITVFGSSVANGHLAEVDCDLPPNDVDPEIRECTYQQQLREFQELAGNEVINRTIDGDTTGGLLARFETDLVPTNPDIVFIGLSLGNEGLVTTPFQAFNVYQPGLNQLIAMCRARGFQVIIGGCYAHSDMDATAYAVTKEMNLLTNGLDVPQVNFLGTIDDNQGHWAPGFEGDALHPNGLGQLEMYMAIVPSVFDALREGKLKPVRAVGSQLATLTNGLPAVQFTPTDVPFHSWTASFRIRGLDAVDGTLFAVKSDDDKTPSIELHNQHLVYHATTPNLIVKSVSVADPDQWHEVTITHRWAIAQTVIYLDAVVIGEINDEQIAPVNFILGNPDGAIAGQLDIQDLLIYRSALNPLEVDALFSGQLIQASLEVYAPLDAGGDIVANNAQSLSQIEVVAA